MGKLRKAPKRPGAAGLRAAAQCPPPGQCCERVPGGGSWRGRLDQEPRSSGGETPAKGSGAGQSPSARVLQPRRVGDSGESGKEATAVERFGGRKEQRQPGSGRWPLPALGLSPAAPPHPAAGRLAEARAEIRLSQAVVGLTLHRDPGCSTGSPGWTALGCPTAEADELPFRLLLHHWVLGALLGHFSERDPSPPARDLPTDPCW